MEDGSREDMNKSSYNDDDDITKWNEKEGSTRSPNWPRANQID